MPTQMTTAVGDEAEHRVGEAEGGGLVASMMLPQETTGLRLQPAREGGAGDLGLEDLLLVDRDDPYGEADRPSPMITSSSASARLPPSERRDLEVPLSGADFCHGGTSHFTVVLLITPIPSTGEWDLARAGHIVPHDPVRRPPFDEHVERIGDQRWRQVQASNAELQGHARTAACPGGCPAHQRRNSRRWASDRSRHADHALAGRTLRCPRVQERTPSAARIMLALRSRA